MSDPLEQPPHSLHGEPIARDYFELHPLELHQDDLEPEEPNEGDIYRGEHSPTRPESISSSSSSSSTSSSSSSSSVFGGRLGAISTLVEHAIARWARARASTSSLDSASTASSSTVSSIVTVSRSYLSRRRRRRSSVADIHNARSEREIAARIRAREESRQVPREFVLYTPVAAAERAKPRLPRDERSGVMRTASLPLILGELNVALKANFRTRRAQDLARAGASVPSPPQATPPGDSPPVFLLPQQDYMMPPAPQEEAAYRKRGRKGKQRATPELAVSETPPLSRAPSVRQLDRAWWLDVSSPTWEDMRALGKLLHLHPLTLEDILQQEPREKLELFPRLGYYFVVFKAIESERTREKRRFMSTISTTDTRSVHYDEGLIGEGNVYLVIFREGIITFHFSDISEHTDAVRNKVLMYVESGGPTMSSDWIAHGIMDSIVDSFFPFLDKIEKEVIDIENNVSTDEQAMDVPQEDSRGASQVSTSATLVSNTSNTSADLEKESAKTASPVIVEKVETRPPPRTQFSLPKTPLLTSHRLKHAMRKLRYALSQVDLRVKRTPTSNVSAPTAIQRVARMRRLVTSLARVLATKSEVVASVKKRLLMTGESGLGNGTVDDQDVFVYMGDVQDHILTLQQALAHYERMLSQSQPIYLTHLRLSASKAKSGSDKAIVILSIISMAVLVSQAVIGVFSMNVHVPRSQNSFAVFGVVISITVTVLCIYIVMVRWWWVRALKKRRRW